MQNKEAFRYIIKRYKGFVLLRAYDSLALI